MGTARSRGQRRTACVVPGPHRIAARGPGTVRAGHAAGSPHTDPSGSGPVCTFPGWLCSALPRAGSSVARPVPSSPRGRPSRESAPGPRGGRAGSGVRRAAWTRGARPPPSRRVPLSAPASRLSRRGSARSARTWETDREPGLACHLPLGAHAASSWIRGARGRAPRRGLRVRDSRLAAASGGRRWGWPRSVSHGGLGHWVSAHETRSRECK